MAKLTSFDSVTCKRLNEEMVAALQPIAEKYGISIRQNGGTFDPLVFTSKIRVKIADVQTVESIQHAEFDKYCTLYGLTPEHYGQMVTVNKDLFAIVGFNLGSPRFPIKVRRVRDGKTMKITRESIAHLKETVTQ